MADAKISALVDGTTPDDADDFVVARAGSTLKLTWAALKAAIGGSLPAGGIAGQALVKLSSAAGDAGWSTGRLVQLLQTTIMFDDPGLASGIDVASLSADAIIMDAWFEITEAFLHGGNIPAKWVFGGDIIVNPGVAVGGNQTPDSGTDFDVDEANNLSLLGKAIGDTVRYVPTRALQATTLQIQLASDTVEINLNGDIDDSVTSVVLSCRPGILPVVPFVIQVEDEQMHVTARDADDPSTFPSNLTVVRGYNSTTPAAHSGQAATVVTPDPWVPDVGELKVFVMIASLAP